MYLHDDIPTLSEMVAATTTATGIDQAYVYKDYFVCMTLKEIVDVNPAFVFKGGTALSKCYGVIDRFSEDVDLGLNISHPTEGTRKKTKAAVQTAIKRLELTVANFDETRSRREFNQYRITLPDLIDGVQPDTLIIETGLMTPASPSQPGEVMSFIGEHLLSINRLNLVERYELERFSLNVIAIERAFTDKVFAIADYYLNGEIPRRQSRHVYDLYKLEAITKLDVVLGELFARVRSEREGNRKCSSASPDVSLADVIREIYDRQIYRHDYESITMPLLYEEVNYDTAATALPKIINFLREFPPAPLLGRGSGTNERCGVQNPPEVGLRDRGFESRRQHTTGPRKGAWKWYGSPYGDRGLRKRHSVAFLPRSGASLRAPMG
jgi:predicted nucleotidyltransferase component of viral defense system